MSISISSVAALERRLRVARFEKASAVVYFVERWLLVILIAALCGIYIINVAVGIFGTAMYWVDELAVNLMAVASIIGASMLVARAGHPSVSLLLDFAPRKLEFPLRLIAETFACVFAIAVLWLSFVWFDPVGVWEFRDRPARYAIETGNFLYRETMSTLAVPRFAFWLVFPLSAACMVLHSVARILRTLTTGRGPL